MTAYLTSGSAVERALICSASVALPHAHFETIYTTRGTMIHAFLESCAAVGREEALAQIPDEDDRDLCAELDLSGLHPLLALAAEVAIAYNPATGTARELGRGAGRAYADVGEDEIPCTLDVVGSRDLENGLRRGIVVDYKSGWTTRRPVSEVVQLDFGALAAARAFGFDLCEVQLVNVYEGFAPHVERRVIEGWEMDAFAAELRERHEQWRELREQWRAGFVPRDFNTGPWCQRCPAWEACPAHTSQLRAILAREIFVDETRVSPIPDAALAVIWNQIHAAQADLSRLKGSVLGIASSRRIFLGSIDGKDRWLGPVISEGNDHLDGEAVYDVVAELHGDDVATKATRVTSTKKDLDAAIKTIAPRGEKAKLLREVYSKLKAIPNAITNKVSVATKEFETPSLLPAPPLTPELAAPAPEPTDGEP